MRRAVRFGVLISTFAMLLANGAAQQPAPEPKPLPMPQERVADSYAIYSLLLPGNQIEWGNAPRSFWLIEDTTHAEPVANPCATSGDMNPHEAIHPPPERQAEFAEVFSDFDAHCHEHYLLDATKFQVKLPIRLLDEAGRKRYVSQVLHSLPPKDHIMQAPPTPDEFKGAAGMHNSFTAVYFNRAHTLAMTEIGMYCGGLCGNWRWVVLERRDGQWQALQWVTSYTIS